MLCPQIGRKIIAFDAVFNYNKSRRKYLPVPYSLASVWIRITAAKSENN